MRHFDLLNLQHVFLYLVPTLIFMVIFGLALGYSHFRTSRSAKKMQTVKYEFPADIKDMDAPFPLSLILIIAGTIIWGFFYILMTGLLEVKI
jgi:hypothetical protein